MNPRIEKSTLTFLKDLGRNNDREWFAANKERYLQAHENFLQFVQALIVKMTAFEPSLAGMEAKKAVFRIYRDTRFATDKSPYKTNMGAFLVSRGKDFNIAGYYLHLEPGNCFLAGGVHMPDATHLRKIRQEISGDSATFLKIVNDRNFKKHFDIFGEQLSRVPKGFDKDDPMAHYLKYKELSLVHGVSDRDVQSEDYMDYCIKVFKLMVPFNAFINEAVMED